MIPSCRAKVRVPLQWRHIATGTGLVHSWMFPSCRAIASALLLWPHVSVMVSWNLSNLTACSPACSRKWCNIATGSGPIHSGNVPMMACQRKGPGDVTWASGRLKSHETWFARHHAAVNFGWRLDARKTWLRVKCHTDNAIYLPMHLSDQGKCFQVN